MCVSVAAARFAETIVYAGEARQNGELVHVAGYQNTAENRVARGPLRRLQRRLTGDGGSTGNAMILHFPAVAGTMSQSNVLATDDCPRILRDMVSALQVPVADLAQSVPTTAATVEVFESGIYTVVLAADARAIPAAFDQIPERKRPQLNSELFGWYHTTFPGWPVALCCFDNTERIRATPMLWWYRPTYPDWLFAPAIDCHTGAIPDLDSQVSVDHWVILGSPAMSTDRGVGVTYRDQVPEALASYLPDRVTGRYVGGRLRNADFVMPLAAVRQGLSPIERRLLAAS